MTADAIQPEGTFDFKVESRLLQELGERLVSSPDVAVSELVKNAYDADSPSCIVDYQKGEFLRLSDSGHGMSYHVFDTRWMTIATSEKTRELYSAKYGRLLTGSKGVGRFAVRVLGKHLELETTCLNPETHLHETLTATFDWDKVDASQSLSTVKVPYIHIADSDKSIGTTLVITKLRVDLTEADFRDIRTDVLSIASPLTVLSPPKKFFPKPTEQRHIKEDPGFEIRFGSEDGTDLGPADAVLRNYVGKAILKYKDGTLKVDAEIGEKTVTKREKLKTSLDTDVYADIRYFPRRSGVFAKIGIDGRKAWSWLRENVGVKVYDKGFGVPPYGYKHDDWLYLDFDSAHSERKWRSNLSCKHIPMTEAVEKDTHLNPMVNVPTTYQLIGAVFVQTRQSDNRDQGLFPSMDRQGFVENSAFNDLAEIVRFSIELLANEDKKCQLAREEAERKEKHKKIRKELKSAINQIESSRTLQRGDKNRLIQQYENLYVNVQDLEDYDLRAREQMDLMSFLGVVAGFMTHEHESALWQLDEVLKLLDSLKKEDTRFGEAAKSIRRNIENISRHVEYTRLFIRSINKPVELNLKAKPRIRHVLKTFSHFADDRGFEVIDETKNSELMPAIPIPMYEGIISNLFTNALKALVADKLPNNPNILIVAWSDDRNRYVSVSDNGVGIPEASHKRIFDPLFTTTSGEKNPLGSGMGLGLPLVKRVLESIKGKIEVVSPPPGFKTRFKVTIPRDNSYGKN